MPAKEQRMSKDTDVKIQKTKVKQGEEGEEPIRQSKNKLELVNKPKQKLKLKTC